MTPTFSGEVQIVSWRDSHTNGPIVSFRLQGSDDLEPFRGATMAKAGMAGDRFAMVLVRIQDDETLGEPELPLQLEPEFVESVGKPSAALETRVSTKRGNGHFPDGLCGLAVAWGTLPHFWSWLSNEFGEPIENEDSAREAILSLCGISSRKELNQSGTAADLFDSIVRIPYAEHRKMEGLE
jgi:hypothetical protein